MFRWVLLVVCVAIVHAGEFDFTVEIRPGKYECFFQSVTSEKHKNLEVEYQVIDGGDLNINFMLIHGADILVQDHMKTDANHKIPLNGNGRVPVLLRQHDELSGEEAANRIKNSLNRIEYYQSTLRSFEHRDKAIMAANLSRVSFYSVLTTAVLLLVACLQVYTIRSLFEENSKLGRVERWGRNSKPFVVGLVLISLINAVGAQQPTAHPATQAAEEVILQMVVEPGKIECFFQPITNPKHVSVELDFQVTEGGEDGHQLLRSSLRCSCSIGTEISSTTTTRSKGGDLLTPIIGFEKITTKVKGSLNEVERIQTQLRAVEARDRSLVEANFERVNFWSVINLLVVLIVLPFNWSRSARSSSTTRSSAVWCGKDG
ncbi:Emp24/gp25L/p24 family protein [Aphelenchoides fujianensis]|nr:Emp24/gp25L/p24 family protein [Aphelenchoides fujianensis]